MEYTFPVTRNTNPKPKPTDCKSLGFGKYFTDHMLIMDYDEGKGWHDGRIVPYGPLSIDPAACTLHYAQMTFEGMKAYKNPEGGINLFRPDMNAKRLQNSNDRLCIPRIDEDLYIEAVKAIVDADRDWVPDAQGTSLYIRPFIISPEPSMAVHPASKYWFIIILSPVAAYYEGNDKELHGSRIWVEEEYIRAAVGGTGFAKCGGNYSCGMIAATEAKKQGCEEVLWLDAKEHRYVEEVGTSNAFFKINGTVFGPDTEVIVSFFGYEINCPLSNTVLALKNNDVPGVIGRIATILGSHNINIASMHWGRKNQDGSDNPHAQAFVAIDQPVSQEIIDELSAAEGVLRVSLLELA